MKSDVYFIDLRATYKENFLAKLGNLMAPSGKYEEAEKLFQKAIALKPDFAAAYLNLGRTYHARNDLDNAAANYEKAFQLDPTLVEAACYLGDIAKDKGEYEKAIDSYNSALKQAPSNKWALSGIDEIKSKMK